MCSFLILNDSYCRFHCHCDRLNEHVLYRSITEMYGSMECKSKLTWNICVSPRKVNAAILVEPPVEYIHLLNTCEQRNYENRSVFVCICFECFHLFCFSLIFAERSTCVVVIVWYDVHAKIKTNIFG